MVVGLSAVLLGGCAHIGKPKTEGSPDLAAAQNGENGASQPEVKLSGSEEASTQVMANISKPYQSPLGEAFNSEMGRIFSRQGSKAHGGVFGTLHSLFAHDEEHFARIWLA